jgi:hypothetical protein
MLQPLDEASLVVSGAELLILARLAHAGLGVLERRDGATEGFRIVAAEVCRRAETERRRIEREARRSRRVSATSRASQGFPAPSSAPTGAYIRTAEAAEAYQVSKQYLRRLASLNEVRTVRGPRDEYLFDTQSLATWAAKRAKQLESAH